jgi:hypothetical protein
VSEAQYHVKCTDGDKRAILDSGNIVTIYVINQGCEHVNAGYIGMYIEPETLMTIPNPGVTAYLNRPRLLREVDTEQYQCTVSHNT